MFMSLYDGKKNLNNLLIYLVTVFKVHPTLHFMICILKSKKKIKEQNRNHTLYITSKKLFEVNNHLTQRPRKIAKNFLNVIWGEGRGERRTCCSRGQGLQQRRYASEAQIEGSSDQRDLKCT